MQHYILPIMLNLTYISIIVDSSTSQLKDMLKEYIKLDNQIKEANTALTKIKKRRCVNTSL